MHHQTLESLFFLVTWNSCLKAFIVRLHPNVWVFKKDLSVCQWLWLGVYVCLCVCVCVCVQTRKGWEALGSIARWRAHVETELRSACLELFPASRAWCGPNVPIRIRISDSFDYLGTFGWSSQFPLSFIHSFIYLFIYSCGKRSF